jgi:hypothetical protein
MVGLVTALLTENAPSIDGSHAGMEKRRGYIKLGFELDNVDLWDGFGASSVGMLTERHAKKVPKLETRRCEPHQKAIVNRCRVKVVTRHTHPSSTRCSSGNS